MSSKALNKVMQSVRYLESYKMINLNSSLFCLKDLAERFLIMSAIIGEDMFPRYA
jgi:hypothetical protein